MSNYNRLPGEPKESPREELAKQLKDFEKKLRDLKKLSTDQTARSAPDYPKKLMKAGDDLINQKNSISALLRSPVANNEKQIMDSLKKAAEALFRQYSELESSISAEPVINPSDSREFATGFVEQEDLAIQDEQQLTNEKLVERNEEIQQVHKDFLEVNSMFKEVANLVEQQGEGLDVAEGNVDTAVKETTRANIELDSANKYQRSAKKKIVVIFIIAAVVVAILIGVVVATTA